MTEQNRASPKKGRGLGEATKELRRIILEVLSEIDGPATVRQIYYLVSVRDGCAKDDAGYGRVQRQVLAMRREGLIPYGRIADNVRRRIHPMTYDRPLKVFFWDARDADRSLGLPLRQTGLFRRISSRRSRMAVDLRFGPVAETWRAA